MGTASLASGQSYNFRRYQVENGLSYNSVMCSLQDKKGFLWFGTKDGLNRYDGYVFKIFRNDPDNAGSIGSNFIHSLFEDPDENMWVGTLRGLYKYNPLKETFTLIASSKNKDIRDIKTDKRGNVWFIGGATLYRYIGETNKVITYNQRVHSAITSIAITENDQIWISTTDGFIQKINPANNTIKGFNVFYKSRPALTHWIEKIYDTRKGFLLIGTSNQGVKLFDLKTLSYKDVLITNADRTAIYARDFIEVRNNEYWIATESGIYTYNIKSGKYLNLRNKLNYSYSISDNAIYTLTKDKEGGVWAGTYFGGLNYLPKPYTYFDKFIPQKGNKGLSGYAVREICEDRTGNVWIGTEDAGLNKFNPKTETFEHFLPTGKSTSISHTNIHALLAVNNELWVGTFDQGLDVLDIKTSKVIRRYRAGTAVNALKSNFVESLLKTKAGEILVGTGSGLYRYNKSSNDFALINEVPGNFHYSALLEDNTGTIWAGTLRDGLYFFNLKSGRSGGYKYNEHDKKSLSSDDINSVYQDTKNNIWVATENGLCLLNERDKNFTRYNVKSGFLSNVFYKILEGKGNDLWISTSRGLVHFNPGTNKLKSYTKSNGLLNDQFNYSSAFKDQKGRMYFGSVKGLIRFQPEQFTADKFMPPVYITGFQVHNKELSISGRDSPLDRSINFTNEVTLNYNQSTFNIDFAALGFTAPEMTSYSFKMKGLDENWTYIKTNRKVYFTDLFPGTYVFMLKAANSSGVWNDRITELKIVIKPPLWASPVAFIFYGLVVAFMIFYGIRYYHHRIKRQNNQRNELWESKKEKELYQAKINFFTYITHEIRTPLTLINGPLEEIIKKSKDEPSITENLVIMKKNTNRLIELTNQLLDFRKTEIKGFSLSFVEINVLELLEENCLRYKLATDEKKLKLNFDLPKGPLNVYADPEALNKILSNLVDNAFKYAKSAISIFLVADDHVFTIEVKSDGNLIPPSIHEKIFEPFFRMNSNINQIGTGLGLPLARALAELHEGTLAIRNDDAYWNTFILTLPRHHAQEFIISKDEKLVENDIPLQNSDLDRPTILLVEDNVEIRAFIANIIKEFNVIQVSNGKKALAVLKEKSVHLIISDIMMPELDGLELCKAVKENIEYTHIPMVLLTAKNTLQSKIEGLEVGADAYLEKPFSPDHLLVQISNLLASRDNIKNYFAHSPLLHVKSMAYNKADEAFLEKLNDIIVKNIDKRALDVDYLADSMNMSRPTLYRKTKAISNLSPHELINITRLKQAAVLLAEGNYKILKIASVTGFSSQAQFGRSFIKQFGMTPSEYVASVKSDV